MSNANRDAQGRWSSANIVGHTPSNVANGGAPNIAAHTPLGAAGAPVFSSGSDPAQRGSASSIPDGSADHWPGAANQTTALLNRSPLRGSGMRGTPVAPPPARDYSAAYRSMGYSSGSASYGERAGDHTISAPGGRAGHGADVPGEGIPGPGTSDAAAGGADVAGAELADLAPLALA